MTVKIAICDDERKLSAQLETLVTEILKEMGTYCETEVFESGDNLCKELERQHFDLIFLDVDIPDIGGVAVSKYIREHLKNYIVKIAYMSENDTDEKELYEFVPIGYLTKPLEEEKVASVIQRYFAMTEQENQVFRYKKRTTEITVPYSDIVYMESRAHRIFIHTINGEEDVFYDTIDNIYQELKTRNFLRIHQSYVVNCRYIKQHHYVEMEMLSGKRLPISRSKRKEINDRFKKINEK